MKRRHRALALLACAIGLAVYGIALAAPLVTVRVTSIDAALRDIETIAKSAHASTTRDQLLKEIAAGLGVEDLSFLDLSRPAAMAMPQEGMMLGSKGWVLAVPVRDGVRALDVLAKQFPERTLDGDLTVLRGAPVETAEGKTQRTLYAALHGRILVIGGAPELVRQFDYASALSGENLPPGSFAFSTEIEPVAVLLNAGLSAARQKLMEMPAPSVPSSDDTGTGPEATRGPQAAVPEMGGGSVHADQPPIADSREGPGGSAGGTAGEKPILVLGDVSPPVLVVKVQPDYPEAARRARIQGKVILEAIVNTDGEIENLRVLRSVPQLDDAAITAVKQWKYKPALQHGRPVKVFFTVIVDFSLRSDTDTETARSVPAQPSFPFPFEPRKLAGFFDLYFGFLHDTIDSLSKLQVSLEVSDGFLIVHGRGVARQGSTLAGFIAAQRDVGTPAIGRMMPVHASVIAAGQLYWTDPSRAWWKQILQRCQSAIAEPFKLMPESEREAGEAFLHGMSLWSSDRIIDCQRGDIAFAMDYEPDGMHTLWVSGLSDTEKCRGAVASMIATLKSGSGGKAFADTEVLEPEKVTTYVYQLSVPKTLDTSETMPQEGLKVRFAEIGDIFISGTDPWASKAIREAASAREGSPPGRGGLVLADLGPFTQRPGVFGRMQIGTLMRQSDTIAKARQSREAKREAERAAPTALESRAPSEGAVSPPPPRGASKPAPGPDVSNEVPETPEALIQALEGPAGAIPFAMRFDEGAATLEFAIPLAMLDAFAKNAPNSAPPARGKSVRPATEESLTVGP